MKVRRKHIERLASETLAKAHAESRPVDLPKICKKLNLEVVKQDAEDSISGMLVNSGPGSILIGVNRRHHIHRQRFTIAHEIGHFLLHNFDGVHFDGPNTGLQINFRNGNSSSGEDLYEREANLFAAELLMPRKLIAADLAKLDNISLIDKDDKTLKDLAEKYRVSVRAITFRLAYLGHLKI